MHMEGLMKIDDLIGRLVDSGGSDLYLKVGVPPSLRVNGEIEHLDLPVLTQTDTQTLAREVLPPAKFEDLARHGDAETAIWLGRLGRYRVSAYQQRGVMGLVIRRIVTEIPNFAQLGLPPIVRRVAEEPRGLILITGTSGSGKTTTIASMIGHINTIRPWHVITLEDPIEVFHEDGRSLIDQREIGADIVSYAAGIRYAVRQDPDVIFIGEIRDEATADAAMWAADTGHLVISTMHTLNAIETVNRMVDLFPADRQRQARRSLAGTLKAVISQRLVPRAGGVGRIPAVEVLIVNGRAAELIQEPAKTDALADIIREGGSYGMQTFDQSLVELVKSGAVAVEEAEFAASNRHDFQLAVEGSTSRRAAFATSPQP
jgi:twitching motility protein PilT